MEFHSLTLKLVLLLCLLSSSFIFAAEKTEKPPGLLLANIYQSDINLNDYWVSEKLDGVRAYWDGSRLISRQGNIFHAPEWFISVLPNVALDGELWLGRGLFDKLSGIVRRQNPDDVSWRNVKYMVFDSPHNDKIFGQRLKQIKAIVSAINAPHIQLVEQVKISSHDVLIEKLDDVVRQGGEGLMLHSDSSLYKHGRTDNLLKLKKYLDAEAVVISHVPGKGKYKGMLGSIEVEARGRKRFKIGSGFSDAERINPPEVGSVITYKYFGLTSKGIPRFASFVRVRGSY